MSESALAASLPHCHGLPSRRQSWRLSGVDPVKADSLAVDFERVAVDHRGDAGHVGQGRGGEQAEGDGEGAHGPSVV